MTSRFFALHWRIVVLVWSALATLTLANCAGAAVPAVSDSVAATPSNSAPATPTPTPTAAYKPADASGPAQNVPVPVLPEEAKAETKEGLLAFARYWFAQLNYAYETGDVKGLNAITSPSCEFCSKLTEKLTSSYSQGTWIAGGRIKTPSVNSTYVLDKSGKFQVVVQVQQEQIDYHAAGTSNFRSPTPASDTGSVMLVVYVSGAWHVSDVHPIR